MRLFAIRYRIDGRWQADGEWFDTRRAARDQATENARRYGWDAQVFAVETAGKVQHWDGKLFHDAERFKREAERSGR